ncbi:FecR family protein [Ulvibacter antarcticus]|nr:FecR family protein [Ulvibacter antarcticus]
MHKWLNGTATPEEVELLKASTAHNSYVKIAESVSQLETPVPDSTSNYKIITSKILESGKVKKLNPYSLLLKIAAIFVFIVGGYMYLLSLDTTISTPIAEKQSFLLPDKSEVILNSNSNLSYNKGKWARDRALELDGEAYFIVKKGKKFKVNTSKGVVSVLGTQFNVYSRDDIFKVSCFEGLVSVAYSDTLIKLSAGNSLKIEDGKLITKTTTPLGIPSWTTNESSFNDADITTVLNELERQYPIKLTAKFSNANLRFTGSFTHEDLNLALQTICDPLHLAYTIDEESVTIYAKRSP